MRQYRNYKTTILLLFVAVSAISPIFIAQLVKPVKAAVGLTIIVTDQQKPGIDGVIAAFLADPLGAGVDNVTVIASGTRAEDQLTYLITQMSAGSTEFDVIGLDPIWVSQFASNNWVEALDSNLAVGEMDNFVKGMVDSCRYNNQYWAYPYFMNLGLLFYRMDILARNGFNESSFATWADLNATANAILANATEQALNPDLVGYVGQFDSYEGGVVNFFEWLGSNGVTQLLDSNGNANLNTPAAQQAMTFLFNLIAPRYTGVQGTPYIIPRSALVMDEGSSVGVWLAGNAIFMRQWTFAYASSAASSNLNATNGPGNYTQFGVAPLPTFTGAADEKSSCVGGAVLSIPKTAQHKTEAMNLIKFLGKTTAQEYELTSIANFPALSSVYTSPPAGYEWIQDVYSGLNKTLARPVNPQYSSISTIIAGYFSQLLSGYSGVTTSLGNMDRDINDLLAAPPAEPAVPGYDLLIMLICLSGSIVVAGAIVRKRNK